MNTSLVNELQSASHTFFRAFEILDAVGLIGFAEESLDWSVGLEKMAARIAAIHPVEVAAYLRRIQWDARAAGAALCTAKSIVKSARYESVR